MRRLSVPAAVSRTAPFSPAISTPSTSSRVEVLRGPQGTLYGASSLGGVLKYVTNEPQTDSFEGRVRGSFESVDGGDMSYSGAGVVNIPVSDSVAIRASGFYRNVGGFIDSIGTVDDGSGQLPTWRTTSTVRPCRAAAPRCSSSRAKPSRCS